MSFLCFYYGVLIWLLLQYSLAITTNYCSLSEKHTMCQYEDKPANSCVNYRNDELTDKDKRKLVEKHNQFRNLVAKGEELRGAPGPQNQAADMRQMAWDNELEMIAKRWADQCIPYGSSTQHDSFRDCKRFRVGQNTASRRVTSAGNEDVLRHVNFWYGEVQYFNRYLIASFDVDLLPKNKHVGDYVQIVWGSTYLLGCAKVAFDQDTGASEVLVVTRIVCNYGPAGNSPFSPLYKTGRPCTACPPGTFCNRRYGGLCATSRQIIEDNSKRDIKPDTETTKNVATKPGTCDQKGRLFRKQSTTPRDDTAVDYLPRRYYKKGVWARGICYCPVELRSSSPRMVQTHHFLFSFLALFTNLVEYLLE